MSVSRIPAIRAKVARQAQLVRRLVAETALDADTTTLRQTPSRRSLSRTLSAPAALLLSVFHLTPAAAKAPEASPPTHDLPRGEGRSESVVIYYEH